MAQVVVATFASLTEAQIVAGALNSGGLHAVVSDQHYGSAAWFEQRALQGFRVTVPQAEAVDATAYLAEVNAPEPRRSSSRERSRSTREWAWRVLAGALVLLPVAVMPLFGVDELRSLRAYLRPALTFLLPVAIPAAWLVIGGLRQGVGGYLRAALMTIALIAAVVFGLTVVMALFGSLWSHAVGRFLLALPAVLFTGWLMRRMVDRAEAEPSAPSAGNLDDE